MSVEWGRLGMRKSGVMWFELAVVDVDLVHIPKVVKIQLDGDAESLGFSERIPPPSFGMGDR